MNATRAAALAAVLGGLVWVIAALLDWQQDVHPVAYAAGLVWLLVSLAALGYALVEKAPVWLRAIVCVATPALGYAVWFTVRDAFDTDWLPVLVAALLMLGIGAVTLVRSRPEAAAQPVHPHRAVR
jgi:hypothetical protein